MSPQLSSLEVGMHEFGENCIVLIQTTLSPIIFLVKPGTKSNAVVYEYAYPVNHRGLRNSTWTERLETNEFCTLQQ